MKKAIFQFSAILIMSVLTAGSVKAQYATDINGKVYLSKTYTDIEGSPYLSDDWLKGTVKMTSTQVYTNVMLKYDESEGKLYFKGKKDEVLEFVDPVAEFSINDNSRRFIALSSNSTTPVFYEVLADGTVKMLKQPIKEIQETKGYGVASVTKTFITADKYYVMKGNSLIPVKKDKKSIITAIGSKQPELEAYIKTNSLNLKNDADLGKLITYYNSL